MKRFDEFSDLENIKMINTVFLPKIDRFSKQIDQLFRSNEEVRDCVRKFDEDISLKASKS